MVVEPLTKDLAEFRPGLWPHRNRFVGLDWSLGNLVFPLWRNITLGRTTVDYWITVDRLLHRCFEPMVQDLAAGIIRQDSHLM
jgi:hypothetical protein